MLKQKILDFKDLSIGDLSQQYEDDLIQCFSISNIKSLPQQSGTEKLIFELFLKYFSLKLGGNKQDCLKELFKLSNTDNQILRQIEQNFKQVRDELQVLIESQITNNRFLDDYTQDLQKKIKQNNYFILPIGFKQLYYQQKDFDCPMMLEEQYLGPHPSYLIIKSIKDGFKQICVIDPFTPYQSSLSDIQKDYFNQGIVIENVPHNSITFNFLKQLVTLKTQSFNGNPYQFSDLYEIILSQLEGGSYQCQKSRSQYQLDERKFQCLPFTLVKKLFLFLLKQNISEEEDLIIYDQIICEFQFTLLLNIFEQYSDQNNYNSLSLKDLQKKEFLLNEMVDKITIDASNLKSINKSIITDQIIKIKDKIKRNQQIRIIDEQRKRQIGELHFKHQNFKLLIPIDLKDLKFIQNKISNSNNLQKKSKSIRQIVNIHREEAEDGFIKLENLVRLLDELQKGNSLTRNIQINLAIEDFIFSFIDQDFQNCFNGSQNLENISSVLLNVAVLYYNCFSRVFCKLFPSQNVSYDPNYYTKFTLIMFSLLALTQELVKKYQAAGLEQKGYTTSTSLSYYINLFNLLPKLSIPSKKWLNLLIKVKNYFEQQDQENPNKIFDFKSTQYLNRYSPPNEIQFMIEFLEQNQPYQYQQLQNTLNYGNKDMRKIWLDIFFSDKYLPKLLTNLRDISFLARLTLISFSPSIIDSLQNFNKFCLDYNSMALSYNWKKLNKITIKMGIIEYTLQETYNPSRYTDFYLSDKDKEYQQIILSRSEENITENEVICSQYKKPVHQSRKQYYSQSFIQLNSNLKYTYLFTALKNQEILFEKEQELFLVKQILHKVEKISLSCQLAENLENEEYSIELTKLFIQVGFCFIENIMQSQCLFYLIEILIFLYDFCSQKAQILIEEFFGRLRIKLMNQFKKSQQPSNQQSIQCSIGILSFKIKKELSQQEISCILELRIIIENNFRQDIQQPFLIYHSMMEYLLSQSQLLKELTNEQLKFLDSYINSPNLNWEFNQNKYLYISQDYCYVPLKGLIHKNGYPLTGLPNFILQQKIYQECCKNQNHLFEITNWSFEKKDLVAYESRNQFGKVRISILNDSEIWVQEQQKDSNQFKTFLPREYFENFQEYLKKKIKFGNKSSNKYLYWFLNNKVQVTNEKRKIKYEINLINNEIYNYKTQQFIIPICQKFDDSNLLYNLFKKIDDSNYIYAQKVNENDHFPLTIHLTRLGLSFYLKEKKLISNDFKGFQLSNSQFINTLLGFEQYLILESQPNQLQMKQQKTLIIPYHPLQKNQSLYFNKQITFDLTQVYEPCYFSFEINENLGQLHSDSTSGNLFLSLLYYNLGSNYVDTFTSMNNFENSFELLNNCWQNQEYNDIEFNLILQFFDFDQAKNLSILDQCLQQENNLKQIFQIQNHGLNPQNINSHSIYLKLMLLLLDSYQTDFLLKSRQRKQFIFNFLFEEFFNYHFNFYMVFKNRIYDRCILSQYDEEKLISTFIRLFCIGKLDKRIALYYECITNTGERKVIAHKSLDYKSNAIQFNKQLHNISQQVESYFENMVGEFSNSILKVEDTISSWKKIQFKIGHFISLFQQILEIKNLSNISKEFEIFNVFLQYLFLQNIKDQQPQINVFIIILQLILEQPHKFRDNNPPYFVDLLKDYSYSLKKSSQQMFYDRLPGLFYSYGQVAQQTKYEVVQLLKKKYIDYNDYCNLSYGQLKNYNMQNNLQKAIQKIFSDNDRRGYYACYEEIIQRLQEKRRNFDLFHYFKGIAYQCNYKDKQQKIISICFNLSPFSIQLTNEQIQAQISQKDGYNINLIPEEHQVEWKINTINLNQIHNEIDSFIQEITTYPERIQFPFDQIDNQQNSLAKNIFSNGYGKYFVDELRQSYDNPINDDLLSKEKDKKFGYLQTPIIEYSFKEGITLNQFKIYLLDLYNQLENNNQLLYSEINENIMMLQRQNDIIEDILLLRQSRKFPIPNMKDILKLSIDINSIKSINPTIQKNDYNIYQSKIIQYIEQFSMNQKVQRILQMINKYDEINQEEQFEEKQRLFQSILQNIQSKRCYPVRDLPFYLLFEIENNILIRQNQYELARAMYSDSDNSLYQLNMGEGKTSVILILLCYMIASGENIVRVNCLESLLGIMQDILNQKFNGFLKRRVYTLPFSRDVLFSDENIEKLKNILSEIQNGKHILLVTPEQRLCLQLKKQETLLEYLNSKDADNTLNWRLHNNKFNQQKNKNLKNSIYQLTSSQVTLKDVLEKLGFIDSNNIILKYPESKQEFFQIIQQKYQSQKFNFFKGFSRFIYSMYQIFKSRSVKYKEQLQQRVALLNQIDQYTFIDILDESDEILRHGKELNYTLGKSQQLDGGSTRWEIPFLIFRLIFYNNEIISYFKSISQMKSNPIVFNSNFKPRSEIGGGIQFLRFVDASYFEENIKPLLIQKVTKLLREKFDEPNPNIIDYYNQILYGSYEDFIFGKLIKEEEKIVELLKQRGQDFLNNFLLAKGWLSHNLFFHVMSYRYRVEYGLSEKRDQEIAIPYKGKDLPSEKSEFSHPDIMIGFTIISYLYNGLTFKQFKEALIKLKNESREDKNAILKSWVEESQEWIKEYVSQSDLEYPNWLESFQAFDIDNEKKLQIAYSCLCRNFKVVKYYLSNFTFPNQVKHYKKRITGNAHSLASEGQTKGFSGTDDKNDSMPEDVAPKRLLSQESTNGKLIHILSRQVNSVYEPKKLIDSKKFLDEVCKYVKDNINCYILIDSGAVVTEMSNFDVSSYIIMNIDQRFKGVVYFCDNTNKINVIFRNLQVIPFSTSHLDTNNLFIYLDESHTRGSDFKLPQNARGILTLGRGMNKDKLVQAAMRLRDLDHQQSIVLWGSEEISSDIAKMNSININEITSKHVIIWASANTVLKNEKDLYPVLLLKFQNLIKNKALKLQKLIYNNPLKSLISLCRNNVADGIEELYKSSPRLMNPQEIIYSKCNLYLTNFYENCSQENVNGELKNWEKENKTNLLNLNQDQEIMQKIIKKYEHKLPQLIKTYSTTFDCDQENEQEEIEEIQQQEEVTISNYAISAQEQNWKFELITNLEFISNSIKNENEYPQLYPIRKCFELTSFQELRTIKWSNQVYVTENYRNTVKDFTSKSIKGENDFMRPVNMVLVYITSQINMVLLSGYEAHKIIEVLKSSETNQIYLFNINDLNGPTMVPRNKKIELDASFKYLITILKLFNGDCYFQYQEIELVQRCLGQIKYDQLHENQEQSINIYSQLYSRQLVLNGFVTTKLIQQLYHNKAGNDIKEIEQQFNVEIQNKLYLILEESIIDNKQLSIDFINLFTHVTLIRGKSNQFYKSTLKSILEINVEWSV